MLKKQPVNGKNGHQPPAALQEAQLKRPLPKKQQKVITISDDVTTKQLAHKLGKIQFELITPHSLKNKPVGVSIADLERVLTSLGETPESNEDL